MASKFVITGSLLSLIAGFLIQFAPTLEPPYNIYVGVVGACILAVVPILVDAGIIPALKRLKLIK